MNRSRLLLGVLVLALITVAWWFLLISPRNAAIDRAEEELNQVDNDVQRLQTQIAQLQDIKDNEVSYIFAIGEMEAGIPENPELDAFIEDITFLAERTGVDLTSIGASPPTPVTDDAGNETDLFQISVSLALEGEYFELLGFLYGVEAMERIVRVDSLAMVPIAPEEDEEPEEPTDGTTTTSSTSTTSTTTTTVAVGRQRTAPGALSVTLTAQLFTRSDVAVFEPPPIDDTTTTTTEAPDEGEGS